VLVVLGLALALVLVWTYQRHRMALAEEEARGAPVIAPLRAREENGELVIVVDSATERSMGLRTQTARAGTRAAELPLVAEVVPDPQAVLLLRAPVTGRLGTVDGRAWPAFGDQIRAGEPLAQVSDALPVIAPAAGEVTRLLARPGEIVQAGQQLLEITNFDRPLVRVTWTRDAPAAPPMELPLAAGASRDRAQARFVGPAQEADPVTRGQAYLYRVSDRGSRWRPGALLTAYVPDPAIARGGILVRASAVVQWDGLAWVYIRRAPGRYTRVRIDTDRPVSEGWLTRSGVAGGDAVVIEGAQQLLSEEFRAHITVGDEVAE
jgi:biotin carboxyl carrier protein